MQLDDPQVAPLIEVFELYMLRDAALADLQEPTVVATRAMLDAGMSPDVILSILDGAVRVAATETAGANTEQFARELRGQIGPWLMGECFDPTRAHGATPPADWTHAGLAEALRGRHYQMVITRRATPADAAPISALIELYVPSGTLLPRSEEFVGMYAHEFIVAEQDGKVVGCVHLDEYSPSLAELRSLAVAPGAQGAGIGRALVDATERFAKARGYATLFAVSNDTEFFARFGFARRSIPELDLERSEVSRYKGVFAKDLDTTTVSHDAA